jgi:hypothetical protein
VCVCVGCGPYIAVLFVAVWKEEKYFSIFYHNNFAFTCIISLKNRQGLK